MEKKGEKQNEPARRESSLKVVKGHVGEEVGGWTFRQEENRSGGEREEKKEGERRE